MNESLLGFPIGSSQVEPTPGFGYGQAWQVVTRLSGVTYFNTSTKPIQLVISSSSFLAVAVNGVDVTNSGVVNVFWASVVIPAGARYVCTFSGGSQYMTELR